jgi:autotransporter translocation and assembly factor TamB
MDLRVQVASGPLLDLPTYLPEVFQHASGSIRAGLHLTGHPRRPAVAGDFQVNADTLAFRGMRTPLKQVVVSARTQNGVIEIDPIAARLGRGTLSGRGRLDFTTGLGSMSIDLRGDKLDFAWGGLEANGVSVSATAQGDPYHPVVRGLLRISRGRFNIAEGLGGMMINRMPLPLESLDYRVDIEAPRNFWVRHSFLNAEMRGKVGLSGTLATYRLDGTIQCVQGWLFFQRRKFLIENGELRFGDREGIIDPYLFLKSSTNVQNTQIFLTLDGQLSSFTPRLYSSPPMAEGDLFALLTLGRSLEQAHQTDARDLFEKEILEGLKNTYLSGLLSSTLSTAFNLDELYLGSLFDRTTGITRSFLRVGKYVGRNFFFAYEGTMTNEGQKTYIIEYRLPRGFLLNLEVEKPINRTRIGVKYDWRF